MMDVDGGPEGVVLHSNIKYAFRPTSDLVNSSEVIEAIDRGMSELL